MWFQGLVNNDLYVANLRQTLAALVERLGVQRPDVGLALAGLQADGVYSVPSYGSETAFARLSPWTLDFLQLIAIKPLSSAEREAAAGTPLNSIFGTLPGVNAWEGNRPVKAHIVTTQLPDEELLRLVRFWERAGVPCLVTHPTQQVPFPAIFPGWDGDPTAFQPECVVLPWEWGTPALFEVYRTEELDRWMEMVKAMAANIPAPSLAPGQPPAGTLHRVLARSFLVADIDTALESLRTNMDLAPGPDELEVASLGSFKRARITAHGPAAGAALELIQPSADEGRAGRYFSMFGPGPLAIRLGTDSLHAFTEELRRRGTRWSAVEDEPGVDRLLIDPAQLCGAEIEIQQMT